MYAKTHLCGSPTSLPTPVDKQRDDSLVISVQPIKYFKGGMKKSLTNFMNTISLFKTHLAKGQTNTYELQ